MVVWLSGLPGHFIKAREQVDLCQAYHFKLANIRDRFTKFAEEPCTTLAQQYEFPAQGNCISPDQKGAIPQNGGLGVGWWVAAHQPTPKFPPMREKIAEMQLP
jgi:hypothetical protein